MQPQVIQKSQKIKIQHHNSILRQSRTFILSANPMIFFYLILRCIAFPEKDIVIIFMRSQLMGILERRKGSWSATNGAIYCVWSGQINGCLVITLFIEGNCKNNGAPLKIFVAGDICLYPLRDWQFRCVLSHLSIQCAWK